MSTKYLMAFLLIHSALACAAPSAPASEQSQPLIAIKAIVLLGPSAPELTPEQLQHMQGVQWIGVDLPGSKQNLQKELEPLLDHHAITIDSVKEIQTKIKDFYKNASHPFVLIQVPPQDVTEGVLQFRILETHVGNVSVEGNSWHSGRVLKQFLGLKKGDEIDTDEIRENLYFINRDPFLQADLIYSQGKEDYTTDVTLAIKERSPIQLYAGVDNTGIESVGRNRWFMGFNWGNAFGLGHQLAYQYTASYNRNQFQAVTVQYIAPLTWHHILNVYGGYSVVNPHFSFPTTRNHGWSCQGSLRYEIPLPMYSHLEHNVIVGGDFKRTNNTFEFSDVSPRASHNVNLTQLLVEYKGSYSQNSFQFDFDGELFFSPGSWLPDQSKHAYQSLRRGGSPTWVYFRGALSYLQRLPANWALYLLSRGQIASNNLLPSEQYGIGGYDTVRGYEQRTLNKDTAFLSTLEVRTPQISIFKKHVDGLQFLAFVDYGWGTDHTAEIPGFKTNYLLGTGPGIRYVYDTYLTMRFDVGAKLHKKHFNGGLAMIHFSVIGSF